MPFRTPLDVTCEAGGREGEAFARRELAAAGVVARLGKEHREPLRMLRARIAVQCICSRSASARSSSASAAYWSLTGVDVSRVSIARRSFGA
jgi:hypothetical protein